MRVLITGANGFVGRHLVRTLLDGRHEVVAACRPDTEVPSTWAAAGVHVLALELSSAESVRAAVSAEPEAIIHLAAVSYSRDASKEPGAAWNINAGGTARLLVAVKEQRSDPLVVVTSSAEVYGEGEKRPRRETEPPRPFNVYGATKLGAEIAAAQAIAEWGLRVLVVRPFPATGPGQENRVLTNWISALRAGKREIEGDSGIVRDFTDVRDTAQAYAALLIRGRPSETYNIATGRGVSFGELFARLAAGLRVNAQLVPPTNPRRDPQHLVGDPSKLRQHTGWQPSIPLDRTLADLIDAQAH